MKYHLHFLPTLFILTLFFPIYKAKISIWLAISIVAAVSALRVIVESIVIGLTYSPSDVDLVILSLAKLLEYLPLGLLSFTLYRQFTCFDASNRATLERLALPLLIAASIILAPGVLDFSSATAHQRIVWASIQAALGAIIMCLAAKFLLVDSNEISKETEPQIQQVISKHALGIFLVHPFFIDLFDVAVGRPLSQELVVIAPKYLFVFLCSLLTASLLHASGRLRAIV